MRLLLSGYFGGIDSERGMAWRVADSMALRRFLGYELTDQTADHSTLSRNRRLIDLDTHSLVGVMAYETACKQLNESVLSEVVADKGDHSNAVLREQRESDIRSYISKPDRGRRHWQGKRAERVAV